MNDAVLSSIRKILQDAGITFRELQHEATLTSADSAKARGEELKVGAKALLLRIDDGFGVFVLPADRLLDSASVKRYFKAKRIRFATADELLQLTGLVPGSLPPFGHPILPFEIFADSTMGAGNENVAFNAGSLTDSIIMTAADWQAVAKPRRFSFAKTRREQFPQVE